MSAASSSTSFKTSYTIFRKIEPFYKGGRVQVSQDGDYMFCGCGSKVNVVEVSTGDVVRCIEQDDETDITTFALSNDDEILVTASQSLLLKQWDWLANKCSRTWKAIHTSPVASMVFDSTSTLLATGGCDSTIKVWDIPRQYCTHNLKGSSGGVHLVAFHPDMSQPQLFSSSMDNIIRIWDLTSSQCVAQLENHYSPVTSLAFSPNNETLISAGRDKICTVWDLKKNESKVTIPVYESVESVIMLPEGGDVSQLEAKTTSSLFLTAGSKGLLRVWDSASATCVRVQSLPNLPARTKEKEVVVASEKQSLVHCTLVPAKSEVLAVNTEHNICMYDAETLELRKQFSGYNGEVLDVRFVGPKDSHIVVATNSPQLKVFELSSSHCQILHGHTDTVLGLDVFRKGRMFASCGKDKTFRIWLMAKDGTVHCIAQGQGHTQGVGAVACSRMKENFVVTASQDHTIKVWPLPDSLPPKEDDADLVTLQAQVTVKAHDKDINSVAVSPNDKLIATGSQDRTAKLWTCQDCILLGVFSGHKRGIWCVQFSPVDQVLATSSADGTIKLWDLQEFGCLKTFEGHDASVLKVIFISQGGQVLSSDSDGLMKLWTVKNSECVKTMEGHKDKVWGLDADKKDAQVATGSTDSNVVLWKDVTQAELEEEQTKREEEILKEQELSNLLHEKRHPQALALALSMGRPHTVLNVIKAILKEPNGRQSLVENITKLRKDQKEAVLKFSAEWNTNSRNCVAAQTVLETLLKNEAPESLLQYEGVKGAVESLLPYTERHFQRLNRLLQASTFVDFLWQNMKLPDASEEDQMEA
ncbi:transducin beta-like protein 3 isoform X1 [Anolis carolinensis]|uniref:transducin beta-like protein 3 isoform X1 n=2 Tax=Anolis carolinensis TaxID=28377 RepID=UPI002F2B2EAB